MDGYTISRSAMAAGVSVHVVRDYGALRGLAQPAQRAAYRGAGWAAWPRQRWPQLRREAHHFDRNPRSGRLAAGTDSLSPDRCTGGRGPGRFGPFGLHQRGEGLRR